MPTPITIAVANVQSGVATTKGVLHYLTTTWKYWLPHSNVPLEKAGELLKQEGVELAFLIEVSGSSLQSGYKIQNDIIGEHAELPERHFFTQKRPRRLTQEGLGMISRYPLTNLRIHPLKRGILTWYLAESTLEIHGRKITLFLAHLALGPKVRAAQFEQIIEIVKNRKGPIILAGDFNESTDMPFEKLLKETPLRHMCTTQTFPSWKPTQKFDRVLLSGEFTVTKQYIPETPMLSDHLPLIVKAELA